MAQGKEEGVAQGGEVGVAQGEEVGVAQGEEEGVAQGREELLVSEDDVEELARDKACGDVREKVKRKFLVDMPEDFYQFWEFCKSLDPVHPDGEEATRGSVLT